MRVWALLGLLLVGGVGLRAEVTDADVEAALQIWRRYEMPEPPREAVLVELVSTWKSYRDGPDIPPERSLAFRVPAAGSSKTPAYFVGTQQRLTCNLVKENAFSEEGAADVVAFELFTPGVSSVSHVDQEFALGLQVWARSFKTTGRSLIGRALRRNHRLFSVFLTPACETATQLVPHAMWAYWGSLLATPGTDRHVLFERMKKAHREFAALYYTGYEDNDPDEPREPDTNKALLDALEKALAPALARPGTPEGDVEALSEVCMDIGGGAGLPDDLDPKYLAVLYRGFEAVPALIDHLNDERLTRSTFTLSSMTNLERVASHFRLAGNLAACLLQAIACRAFELKWVGAKRSWEFDRQDAERWWAEAQKLGEKRYLARNMVRHAGEFGRDTMRLVSWKYPDMVRRCYLATIWKDWEPSSLLADSLARCDLPRADKAKAFGEGARSENLGIRFQALEYLKEFDESLFVEVLVETLDSFGETPSDSRDLFDAEVRFTSMVCHTTKAQVWKALLRAAKRANTSLRMFYIDAVGAAWRAEETRTQRLKFLAAFFSDTAEHTINRYHCEGPMSAVLWNRITVKDFAMWNAGYLLEPLEVPGEGSTTEQWRAYRRQVRQALKNEGIEAWPD